MFINTFRVALKMRTNGEIRRYYNDATTSLTNALIIKFAQSAQSVSDTISRSS